MKKYIKYIISLLVFILSSMSFINSQEIIEYNKDTMIVISPKQVDIMNSIIIDFEYSKKNIESYKRIINIDSLSLLKKDSIICTQRSLFNKKEDYYKKSIGDLEDSIKNERKKRNLTNSILGSVIAILGILFIIK